jgi:chromosomal replication initiator protein
VVCHLSLATIKSVPGNPKERMEFTAADLWSKVLEAASGRLPEQTFRTWLAGTVATGLTDSELMVEAPSDFHVEWIEDKYGPLLTDLIEQTIGRQLTLTVRCGDEAPPLEVPSLEVAPPGLVPSAPSGGGVMPSPSLNPRYSFDRFVVGDNVELATAACHAVAGKPARMYNPLFLYGGVGLGKTHLMHAIGNEIRGNNPASRIAYLPTEQFTNELVTAIQNGTTAAFRRTYRQIDLLLVDDIQFLQGKERTQEEFFHTFNALYDAQKQIVLTSDRPPKELPGLEERLVSRFEWGLVVDITQPDYETRIAILRKKAEDDDLTLENDVIDFIARSCTSSVRELEGAVIKLLAYSSLTNQEISVELARRALQATFGHEPHGAGRSVSPERIRGVVANHWNVREEALSSKRRTKDLTVPRQVAMYLIKDLLDYSLVKIGQLFGGRDHSTVIHSIRKVEETMANDSSFRRSVEAVRDELMRPA